ncbi:MAG: DUF6858 family protein [Sulfurimonas sp.]|uniref:DUF6858 family protein n=1 Tax=Sulfurimonas sp. TaxID=2022749 RepID=UPI0025F78216|nr:hypothetical protein [Sulfurimonas sp.]MCK9455317.1 hypothetical protein [Sulfurimonas sp.]
MNKTVFMQKYPVYSLEFAKEEMKVSSTDEVVEYLKQKISNHPVAVFISVFDHYGHTKNLGGEMIEGLIDAKNVIFCFGQAIPDTRILAVRPRSIGISEFENKIIIDFLEAPKEELQAVMQSWINELKI